MTPFSLLRAIITVLVTGLLLGGPALAQTLNTPPDGITVTGIGRASTAPDSSLIQIALSGGDMYGQPPILQPMATPGAAERETVQPIVEALVSAGIPESDINLVVTPYIGNAFAGMYGPVTSLIEVTLNDPTSEGIANVIGAATIGAGQARMPPPSFTVLHRLDDCSALEEEARRAAFDEATRLASVEADIIGVSVGDVVAIRDSFATPAYNTDPFMVASGEGGCSYSGMTNVYGPFGPAPYDMSDEPEVVAIAATDVTFSIQGASTP